MTVRSINGEPTSKPAFAGRTVTVLCAAFLAVAGCTGGGSKPIADSTMVDILVELHLLNARMQVTERPFVGARDSIFQGYGIDSTTYANALSYYVDHPAEYASIYGRVVDELTAERAPVNLPDSVRDRLRSTPPSL